MATHLGSVALVHALEVVVLTYEKVPALTHSVAAEATLHAPLDELVIPFLVVAIALASPVVSLQFPVVRSTHLGSVALVLTLAVLVMSTTSSLVAPLH